MDEVTAVIPASTLRHIREEDPRVVVIKGNDVGRTFMIRASTTIGRDAGCDMVLQDPYLSRHHARIVPSTDQRFLVEDLGSQNGVVVNGRIVHREVPLELGDRIVVGNTVLLFTHHDPLQEQLLQKEKMEAIGRLGAGLAHDLNNMLAVATTCVEFLQSLPDATLISEQDVKDSLADTRNALKMGAELIGHIGRFAIPTEVGTFDISGLVTETASLAQHTLPSAIAVDVRAEESIDMLGDRGSVQQSLMNLILNARDAMPDGGTLLLSTRREDHNQAISGPKDWVVITVEDSGQGMDPEVARRVFEPLFTTKHETGGTGLGLTRVYETIQGHGGNVNIDSTPGVGTVVEVFLPVEAVTTNPVQGTTLPLSRMADVPVESSVILVVDDDPGLRRSTERLLRHLGHQVVIAPGGAEALELYQQHSPDWVLLDLDMPEMNGRETLQRLMAMDERARIIIVSGDASAPTIVSELEEAGAQGVLSKPFTWASLSGAMQRATRSGP